MQRAQPRARADVRFFSPRNLWEEKRGEKSFCFSRFGLSRLAEKKIPSAKIFQLPALLNARSLLLVFGRDKKTQRLSCKHQRKCCWCEQKTRFQGKRLRLFRWKTETKKMCRFYILPEGHFRRASEAMFTLGKRSTDRHFCEYF